MDFEKYKTLRTIVYRGLESYGWLNTKVLSKGSEQILKYILPKTNQQAAMNLSIHIACLHHDQNIKGNKVHLFRFPQNVEIKLHNSPIVENDQDILTALVNISCNIAVEGHTGPINIGSISELPEDYILQSFAQHYLLAFKNGYKTYPYLT